MRSTDPRRGFAVATDGTGTVSEAARRLVPGRASNEPR